MAAIHVNNLTFCYDNSFDNIFEHVTFTLDTNWKLGFIGRNGKGKTTFFRILMGLESADSGQITGLKDIRISAVFQEDRLCETFTPVDNVLLTAASSLTKAQAITELQTLLPKDTLTRPVYTLSGGQKRRTAICRALLAPFDLLILDEPFTGLDEETRMKVIRYLKKKCHGKLVLLSTHQETDAEALGGIVIHL